ncbi:MAG: 50S ribosomal protein L24 [Clostridia bacterium]|nr:50S ribosomal protein L24 [Clostridia bacterium]
MNVKLNDTVLVITGKYAGVKGRVTATKAKTGKIIVEGVNLQKKTQKARRANDISRIIEKEGPIDASNVMVICPECGMPVRVKYDTTGKEKVRVCRKCGAVLDKGYSKKAAKEAEETETKRRVRKRARKAASEAEAEESTLVEESKAELDVGVGAEAEAEPETASDDEKE